MQRHSDDLALTIGSSIGPYRLTGLIGQGGMGLVYVAEHTLIGKKVAVKTVRPELVEHQGVAERFINEARAVNTIGDEHIVDIFDAGQTPDGALYCVMELLVGESLQDFMKRQRRVPLETALHVTLQIARALHACHHKHIIHRDLKPGNIFIVQRGGAPFVKILDFGIAKIVGQASSATHSNAIIGTPFYMAPEQCRGSKDLDHRIDIYALGVILYELCTGSLPFEGDSAGDVIIKQATELPEDPCLRSPELPQWLCLVILRALEKNREARFLDMAELAMAIESHAMPGHYTPPPRDSSSARVSYPSTPGGSLRGPPTQSIHVTPLEYQAQHPSGTFEPAVTPGSAGGSSRRSPPGGSSARAELDLEPRPRGVSKVLLAVAAVVVIALVVVAGRYVTAPAPTAASSSEPAPKPSETAPTAAKPAPTAEPSNRDVQLVTPVTDEPARPAPPPIRTAPIEPATPVVTSKSRPVHGKAPAAPASPVAPAEPQVTPAEPPSKKAPHSLDHMLPPPENLLPPGE